jgi:hypothetical protein
MELAPIHYLLGRNWKDMFRHRRNCDADTVPRAVEPFVLRDINTKREKVGAIHFHIAPKGYTSSRIYQKSSLEKK